MAEYIDRQQIIGELNHIIETYMSDDTFQCFFAAAVVTDILSNVVMCQPSDDVAPTAAQRWIRKWKKMGKKLIVPREKSLGKRMCRVMTGHKPREKWGQHDHYGRMLYYYQCKRCGHLFWTEEAPSRQEQKRFNR